MLFADWKNGQGINLRIVHLNHEVMKRKAYLLSLTIFSLSISISLNLYSQSSYVLTNNTNYIKYVQLDIATDPTVCNYYGGIPIRIVTIPLAAPGCPNPNSISVSLGPNEWVYKIGILEESSCASCGFGGSVSGVAFSPCTSSSASLNYCTSTTVTADNTTYCDFN